MEGRLIRTNCDKAGDYVVPNVLSPRDQVIIVLWVGLDSEKRIVSEKRRKDAKRA